MRLHVNLPGPFSVSTTTRTRAYGVCGVRHRSRHTASRCRDCATTASRRDAQIAYTRMARSEWWRDLAPTTRRVMTMLMVGAALIMVALLCGLALVV
jgi:hypothetical protein